MIWASQEASPLMPQVRELLKTVARRAGLFGVLRAAEIRLQACRGGIHDPEYRELPADLDGGLVVDIGANIGQSVISLRSLFPRSPIVAFEPNPGCAAMLQRVAAATRGTVQVHQVGIGERAEDLYFYVPVLPGGVELLQEGSCDPEVFAEPVTLRRIGNAFVLKRITVPVRRLDDYDLSPALVKIDVQGFEIQVLRGALGTIRRARPALLLERDVRTEESVTDLLRSLGYDGRVLGCNALFLATSRPSVRD